MMVEVEVVEGVGPVHVSIGVYAMVLADISIAAIVVLDETVLAGGVVIGEVLDETVLVGGVVIGEVLEEAVLAGWWCCCGSNAG